MYNFKKGNLSNHVYTYLLDSMMNQEILQGEKIHEEKIATQLNVSRTPIREALRLLAADGLVNIFPKRFAEVITFSKKDIMDLGLVRLNNELLAAELAVYYGSDSDFSNLKKIDEECQEYAKNSEILKKNKKRLRISFVFNPNR